MKKFPHSEIELGLPYHYQVVSSQKLVPEIINNHILNLPQLLRLCRFLHLKRQSTAADDSLDFYYCFSDKIMLNILCESYAWPMYSLHIYVIYQINTV